MSTDQTAKEVQAIEGELGPLLRSRSHEAAVYALLRLAAHHNLHHGGDEEDLVRVARAAHASSERVHARCGGEH